MVLELGVAVLVVLSLTAWTVKEADERGRFAVGWALLCLAAGAAATTGGILAGHAIAEGDLAGNRTLLALVPAFLAPIVAMAAVAIYVARLEPVAHVRRGVPVRRLGARGPQGVEDDVAGRLFLDARALRLELEGQAPAEIPYASVRRIAPDGECVRLAWTDADRERDALLLPLGRPNTPAGRRKQAETLAYLVRSRKDAP